MATADKKTLNDVVLQVSSSEDEAPASIKASPTNPFHSQRISQAGSSSKLSKDPSFELTVQTSNLAKPPSGTVTKRLSIPRSTLSKPKSRLIEPVPYAADAKEPLKPGSSSSSPDNRDRAGSTPAREAQKSAPITPKTPLIGEDDDDDEEVYKTANLKLTQITKRSKKVKPFMLVEWVLFVLIVGVLITSLTWNHLHSQSSLIWQLALWRWCVLVLVIFCGRLFSEWFINLLIFLIERNFLLRKKVLYFVYGLQKSVQVFIWIALILLAWVLLIRRSDVKRSEDTIKALNYITRGLASCLIGAAIWVAKNLLVKLSATSFQTTRFFDRIQESLLHQYTLQKLSGPPLMEIAESVGMSPASTGRLSFKNLKKEKGEEKRAGTEEVIDMERLKKMKQEKVSAWALKGLIDVIRGTGLSTIAESLEDDDGDVDYERVKAEEEITSEWEAQAAAYRIFQNMCRSGNKYIEKEDLLRFLKKEEVDLVFPKFEGAVETGKIKRKSLKNWLVNVYCERKALVHSLNDTKTAIEELNRISSVIIVFIIVIVWLILMELLTTQVLVFVSSQMLLVVFVFGNTAKTVFEAIVFVFIMHPFDVGDRCVVDGVQMVVEEMNILTTVFLRYDNEKIFYPNCILATKPISNFYRSPEMGDGVEFAVDFSTSIETIAALKAKVKAYLESKPLYWRPGHSVVVKDIVDVNKMMIGLYVTHTINFQNYGDKSSRRSELVLELKRIFEELGIQYRLLPQQVQVTYAGSANPTVPPPWQ